MQRFRRSSASKQNSGKYATITASSPHDGGIGMEMNTPTAPASDPSRSHDAHRTLHLIVLVHGLFGSPSDMDYVARVIIKRFSHSAEILLSSSNKR